jgi:hypothetical protein
VKLGTLNSDGTLTGGAIVNSGSRAARVTITADNSAMAATTPHLLGSVQVKSIDTRAGITVPGVDQTVGGDVIIDAHATTPATPPHGIKSEDYGDVTLFGDILTTGGASLVAGDPLHDGGSVRSVRGQDAHRPRHPYRRRRNPSVAPGTAASSSRARRWSSPGTSTPAAAPSRTTTASAIGAS